MLCLSPSAVTRRRRLGWRRFSGLSILILYYIILYLFHPPPDTKKFYRPRTKAAHRIGRERRRCYYCRCRFVWITHVRLIFFLSAAVFLHAVRIARCTSWRIGSCSVHANRLKIVPRTNRKKNHIFLYCTIIARIISRRGVWWPKRKYVVLPGNILLLLLLRGFATLWRTRSVLYSGACVCALNRRTHTRNIASWWLRNDVINTAVYRILFVEYTICA